MLGLSNPASKRHSYAAPVHAENLHPSLNYQKVTGQTKVIGAVATNCTAVTAKINKTNKIPISFHTTQVRMADDAANTVIALRQVGRKKALSGAERAKAYRERKRQGAASPHRGLPTTPDPPLAASPPLPVTFPPPTVVTSRHNITSIAVTVAAVGLGAVSVIINGWFARSLGASDVAGWLFLAVGVAVDTAALALPSCAAGLWQARQRGTALVGWCLWVVTLAFTVTASIGFASTNIGDVTLMRASRVTPAVTTARAALEDATAARDRECKGGVGRFCREREAAVAERRQLLDAALSSAAQSADPQSDAAVKLITWLSAGTLRPTPEDFAMFRLVLMALLPQVGGVLLIIGRPARTARGVGSCARLEG